MDRDTLKAMILENQFLTRKADKKTVVSGLCGLQAQFFSNAFHRFSYAVTKNSPRTNGTTAL